MSDAAEAPTAEAPVDTMTAGVMLRQAREAAGLQLPVLALSLKVPARKLEALEEDRYDLLPDSVFVRALASSVCRTLKIDAQPVLQRLPQSAAPRLLDENAGINAPFRAPGDAPRPSLLNQLSSPVVLVVIVVLLAALVLIFLPSARKPSVAEKNAAPAGSTEAPPQSNPAAELQAVSNTAVAAMEPSRAETKTAEVKVSPAEPTVAVPSALPKSAAETKPAVPPAVPSAPAAAAAKTHANTASPSPAEAAASAPIAPPLKGLVVFRASSPSWVEVVDADGKPILRRLLEAGQSARANSGTMPLSVTVGSADTVEVDVRGKHFDLKPVSKGNVARFEVK